MAGRVGLQLPQAYSTTTQTRILTRNRRNWRNVSSLCSTSTSTFLWSSRKTRARQTTATRAADTGSVQVEGESFRYLSVLEKGKVLRCHPDGSSGGDGDESVCPAELILPSAGEGESAQGKERRVLFFLSHFGDLTSWEYAQKLKEKMDVLLASSSGVSVVGLGSPEAGRKFAELLDFPIDKCTLYAEPEGTLYKDLGFAQGFLPEAQVSPYVKLLGMLAGVGSPGTIQEVLRGYIGDRDSKQIFENSPFDILGKGYQRPFELATLRLSNMIGILPNWSDLVSDEKLLTQQGGTMVFEGENLIHLQKDDGILKYASIDKVIEALEQ